MCGALREVFTRRRCASHTLVNFTLWYAVDAHTNGYDTRDYAFEACYSSDQKEVCKAVFAVFVHPHLAANLGQFLQALVPTSTQPPDNSHEVTVVDAASPQPHCKTLWCWFPPSPFTLRRIKRRGEPRHPCQWLAFEHFVVAHGGQVGRFEAWWVGMNWH